MGVLSLWVLSVGLLYGEDTRSVDFLYLHAPGAMDDTLLVYQDAHMGDGSMRSVVFVVIVVIVFSVVFVVCVVGLWFAEESQIAGLGVLESVDLCALRGLLGGVAEQVLAEEREDDLREAGAVHAHGILTSPQVGDIQEETHRLQQVRLIQR